MKSPLRLTINRSIIVDQVAQFLIATKQVPYNSEIADIQFYDLDGPAKEYSPEIVILFKDEEVKLIYYGDATS